MDDRARNGGRVVESEKTLGSGPGPDPPATRIDLSGPPPAPDVPTVYRECFVVSLVADVSLRHRLLDRLLLARIPSQGRIACSQPVGHALVHILPASAGLRHLDRLEIRSGNQAAFRG